MTTGKYTIEASFETQLRILAESLGSNMPQAATMLREAAAEMARLRQPDAPQSIEHELAALDARREALDAVMGANAFNDLHPLEKTLMRMQAKAMYDYRKTLESRILFAAQEIGKGEEA